MKRETEMGEQENSNENILSLFLFFSLSSSIDFPFLTSCF